MARITKISQKGLDLIKQFEGFSSKPYLCPANVPTIGYGTTLYPIGSRVRMTDKPIDEYQAEIYLQDALETFESGVDSFTRDDITQHQFDALVVFSYNLGLSALKGSTLLKKVNANPSDPTIKTEFMKWVNAGGKKLQGLVNRRNAEANLYFL